jgi:hypothetical protein
MFSIFSKSKSARGFRNLLDLAEKMLSWQHYLKVANKDKNIFFIFFASFKNSPKNLFLSFSITIENRKNSKMGYLTIFEEIITVLFKVVKIFKNPFFTQTSITSSKMKFIKLFKTKLKFKCLSTNWFQSMFEFDFQKLCSFTKKIQLFSIKGQKILNSKFRPD